MNVEPTTSAAMTERQVRRWCDELLLALRMRDVPGERIGAVLTEVRAHLADSGEVPEEAFGPARAYAASLAGDPEPEPLRARVRTALRTAGGFLGFWFLGVGAIDLVVGERSTIGPVMLAVLVVAAALAAPAASWAVAQVASVERGRTVVAVIAVTLAVTAVGWLTAATDEIAAVTVSAWWPLGAGAALAVLSWIGGPHADPVVTPFESPGAVRGRRRRDALLLGAASWALGLAAVALGVLAVVLTR